MRAIVGLHWSGLFLGMLKGNEQARPSYGCTSDIHASPQEHEQAPEALQSQN